MLEALVGLGIIALAGKGSDDVKKLADGLREALPPRLGQFADVFAAAALETSPVVISPAKWALFGAAVIDREAFYRSGGWALKPPGPAGTGDPTLRWRKGPPAWADQLGLLTGRTRDKNGVRQYEIRPPTAGGATVAGWGYGLAQDDWETGDRAFVESGEWKLPEKSIPHAFRKLRGIYDRAPGETQERFQRTADDYNAGGRALTAADPDELTTGGDYGADVLARAAAFEEDLPA